MVHTHDRTVRESFVPAVVRTTTSVQHTLSSNSKESRVIENTPAWRGRSFVFVELRLERC